VSSTQPFDPDALYCVYCHAVAAGMCAACGALVCGDCAELTMGLTRHRAICRQCAKQAGRPVERRLSWTMVAAAALLAAIVAILALR
jgi:hypothetical protein